MIDEDEVRERQRGRFAVISALVQAVDRRDELLPIIAAATSDEEALDAIAELLGLADPALAMAVYDLQLRRLTEQNRARFRAEYDELRAELES